MSFKKKWLSFVLTFAGLALTVLAFYSANTISKEYSGVMSGIGSGLLGLGLVGIVSNIYN